MYSVVPRTSEFARGVYLEPEDIALTGYQEIVDALKSHISQMLDGGAYVGIASHDMPVIEHTLDALKQREMGPSIADHRKNAGAVRTGKGPGYEFQMLLGVRGNASKVGPRRASNSDIHSIRQSLV